MFLGEYLSSVVVMSAILGLISYISYPSSSEKTVKFAATALLLYTALTPLLSFANKISSVNPDGIIGNLDYENVEIDGEYEKVAEAAFKEGLFELLSTKYSIEKDCAEVIIFGFDFQSMKAQKIKILLFGNGVAADFRGIEEYITELGLGECEVNIRIG